MHLTVVTKSKQIYLETKDAIWPNRKCFVINNNSFWESIDQDIWAIQYHTDGVKEIEYKASTGRGNVTLVDGLIDINIFINKFNEAETEYQNTLEKQKIWDAQGLLPGEVNMGDKIKRLGIRPMPSLIFSN